MADATGDTVTLPDTRNTTNYNRDSWAFAAMNARKVESDVVELKSAYPIRESDLNKTINVSPPASRASLPLRDEHGIDRCSWGEVEITNLGRDT